MEVYIRKINIVIQIKTEIKLLEKIFLEQK